MRRDEIYLRYQLSIANAARAACPEARLAHHALAAAYADRIRALDAAPARLHGVPAWEPGVLLYHDVSDRAHEPANS